MKRSTKKEPPKKRTAGKAKASAASTSKIKAKEQEPEEDEKTKSAATSDDEAPADDEGGESELEEDAAAASKRCLKLPRFKYPDPLMTYPSAQTQRYQRSKRLISKGGGKLATSTLSWLDLWKSHRVVGRVPYAALAKVFALIEATTKRLEKTALLTSFLLLVIRRSGPGDFQPLLQAVYLCINRVRQMQTIA